PPEVEHGHVFFFQAEDGIRARNVTGVQTCALPIYCMDPASGACPCYNAGDVFEFYRDGQRDDFWHMGINTLVTTAGDPDAVAGGDRKSVVKGKSESLGGGSSRSEEKSTSARPSSLS